MPCTGFKRLAYPLPLLYGVAMTTALQRQHAAAIVSDPSVLTNASVHLSVAEVKQQIHESGICYAAIEMAETGKRPLVIRGENGEPDSVEWEDLSEAAHVDMIKFIVKKVLPDAKDVQIADKKASHDYWEAVIAADEAKG